MPTTRDEVRQIHRGFHAIAGIPRVIGVVDGKLIPIHNPSLVDLCWIGRKHYAAINTQVVVDHDGLITDIVARWHMTASCGATQLWGRRLAEESSTGASSSGTVATLYGVTS